MPDEAQAMAVHELNRVWLELIQRFKASKKAFRRFRRRDVSQRRLYVGRSGTWQNLAQWISFTIRFRFRRKTRMHFHHFMQHVHREVKQIIRTA